MPTAAGETTVLIYNGRNRRIEHMGRPALYQKYRSQTFDEVIGQQYVVRSIQNAIRTGTVGHAYLFCGPRGTGKTTMARLLARAINCEHPEKAPCGECENCKEAIAGTHPDIIEINAANETHVDDIRDLIDRAQLAPMLGKYKIYIIDEVHQLSSSAASALLKTLEEPPAHVIFILATTDPQKLLPTIISRCQRFDFTRIDTEQIKDHLLDISNKEGFQLDPDAAEEIAELADGGMRDSLSILDQAYAYAGQHITADSINEIFGLASMDEKMNLLTAVCTHDTAAILNRLKDAEQHGSDLKRLTHDLIVILKDAIVASSTNDAKLLQSASMEQCQKLLQYCRKDQLLAMIRVLSDAEDKYRYTYSVRDCLEVACLEMMQLLQEPDQRSTEKTQASAPFVSEQKKVTVTPIETKPETVTAPAESVREETQTEPVITSTPTETETKPAETVPEAVHIHECSQDEVLGIMAASNKTCKADDQKKVSDILDEGNMDQYKSMLLQTEIGASGPDALLFVCKSSPVVHTLMEDKFNKGFYFFLKDHGIDKMPYAVTSDEFKSAASAFMTRMRNKDLPQKIQVTRWQKETEESKQEDVFEKLVEGFGAENIEVIDDEQK